MVRVVRCRPPAPLGLDPDQWQRARDDRERRRPVRIARGVNGMRRSLAGLMLLTACSAAPAPVPVIETATPEAVGELAGKTLALWECSALASWVDNKPQAERLFKAGFATGSKFIAQAKLIDDPALQKRMGDRVPIIISQNLGGPSNDFMLGRIMGAIGLDVEDKASDRETWTHQENHPRGTNERLTDADSKIRSELRNAKAEQLFRDQNCALLS